MDAEVAPVPGLLPESGTRLKIARASFKTFFEVSDSSHIPPNLLLCASGRERAARSVEDTWAACPCPTVSMSCSALQCVPSVSPHCVSFEQTLDFGQWKTGLGSGPRAECRLVPGLPRSYGDCFQGGAPARLSWRLRSAKQEMPFSRGGVGGFTWRLMYNARSMQCSSDSCALRLVL